MPRRIGNTTVPRNPVTRSPLLRRGGVHQRSRTSERQQSRSEVWEQAQSWREEIDQNDEFDKGRDEN